MKHTLTYILLGLAVGLLALAGCSDDNPVADGDEMVALTGNWDLVMDTTGTPVSCVDPQGTPVQFAFPTNTITAVGDVSVLGETNSVVTLDACTIYPEGYLQGPGTFTHTGSNGDAIFGTYVGLIYLDGTISFDPDVADPPIVVTGGSGRFVDADGWAIGGGTIDLVTGVGSFWIEGMISAPN